MRKPFILAFAVMLLMGGVLLFLACSSSGNGDDDSGGGDEAADDNSGGGDDSAGDDDAAHGTWTDSSSGLIWQDPPSSNYMSMEDAKAYCDNLSLDGHDDWRLPTISELRSLIRGCDATSTDGACGLTDDCLFYSCHNDPCSGCDILGGPGSGGAYWPEGMTGKIKSYWSSSMVADNDFYAWTVYFVNGFIDYYEGNDYYTRCVR